MTLRKEGPFVLFNITTTTATVVFCASPETSRKLIEKASVPLYNRNLLAAFNYPVAQAINCLKQLVIWPCFFAYKFDQLFETHANYHVKGLFFR